MKTNKILTLKIELYYAMSLFSNFDLAINNSDSIVKVQLSEY